MSRLHSLTFFDEIGTLVFRYVAVSCEVYSRQLLRSGDGSEGH
jgi:hypothetical protein